MKVRRRKKSGMLWTTLGNSAEKLKRIRIGKTPLNLVFGAEKGGSCRRETGVEHHLHRN